MVIVPLKLPTSIYSSVRYVICVIHHHFFINDTTLVLLPLFICITLLYTFNCYYFRPSYLLLTIYLNPHIVSVGMLSFKTLNLRAYIICYILVEFGVICSLMEYVFWFIGSIPDELGFLVTLDTLQLNENNLSSGNMSIVKHLWVDYELYIPILFVLPIIFSLNYSIPFSWVVLITKSWSLVSRHVSCF